MCPCILQTRPIFVLIDTKQASRVHICPTDRRAVARYYFLRDAVVKHIALTRAVVCRTEDILVTSGAQQAFDLLARALVTPNRTVVAVEDPGYPPMRVAFAAAGARAGAGGSR